MTYSWILLAWRRFKRDKVNTLINAFGLTLGILVFLMILTYVQHEFSYDKFHKDQDRIYRLLRSRTPTDRDYAGISTQAVLPGPLAGVLQSDIAGIESVSRVVRKGTLVVEADNKTYYEDQYFASDHDIFEVLTFDILSGSEVTALSGPLTLALSETTALRYFGTTDVIGKSMELTGQQNLGTFIVDAVFKDFPANSSFHFNIVIRFEDFIKATQPNDLMAWNNWNYNYFVKMVRGVDAKTVEQSILNYFEANKHDYKPGDQYTLEPIVNMYLNPRVNFSLSPQGDVNRLYLLAAIAVLVLLIAIVNYVNLTTARSLLRAKEVGVRKVTGAIRSELIIQFLGDAWIISIISLCVALLILKIIWPTFTEGIGKDIPISTLTNGFWITAILFFPFILGLAAGLYPAIYLSSFNPVKVLKGSFSRSQEGSLSRDVLITFQFVISAGLVISVLIINSQLKFIETKDPGFAREHIITVPMADEGVRKKKEIFQSDLLKNPEIVSASMSSSLPHAVGQIQSRTLKAPDREIDVSFYTIFSDDNFLSLYNIELIDGRNFTPGRKTEKSAYIINETAAKSYGWDNPVGMEFTSNEDTIRIIGLIRDIHFSSYRDPIKPFRLGYSINNTYYMSVRVKGEKLPEVLAYIESSYKKFTTSKVPYTYNFFDDQYDKVYKNDYMLGKLITVFSVIAVIIATLGLYSISIHSVNLRLKEIGVRKVLGAQVHQIVLILSRKFMLLVGIAVLIAIPATYYVMDKWLSSFAYHVSINSIPFLLALVFILIVSMLTISVNILKAAESNPVDVLRSE